MSRNQHCPRKILRAAISGLLTVSMSLSGIPLGAFAIENDAAQDDDIVLVKPESVDEEGILADESEGLVPSDGQPYFPDESELEDQAYGAMPLDIEVPSVHDANERIEGTLVSAESALPSSYDSRSENLVTAVKTQSPFGVCWAFSTIGALESSLLAHNNNLSADSLDLSERHLAYFTYHQQNDALGNIEGDKTEPVGVTYSSDQLQDDPYLVSGGNYYVASLALASWAGAVEEKDAPYEELVTKRNDYTAPVQYGQGTITDRSKGAAFLAATALDSNLARSKNYAWLTGFSLISHKDRDDIKAAIMQNGGVTSQINTDSKYRSYYYDGTSTRLSIYDYDADSSTNHEVEIVGWDDNYSRLNFGKHRFMGSGSYDIPETAQPLSLDESVSLTGEPYTYQYATFTPQADGVYRFTAEKGTYPDCYLLNEVDNKLAFAKSSYVADSGGHSKDIEMLAGRTYYFSTYLNSGSDTVSLARVGDIDWSDVPEHDGAWLAKNSWGINADDTVSDGYVWISYEDASFIDDEVGVFYASTTQPYDNNYQYDGGTSTNCNYVDSGGSIANVFEAKANIDGAEELKAIGLRLNDVNVDYEVQVYLDPTDANDPTSGTAALASPLSGTTRYMGYYTIELPISVYLSEGTRYAVVVTLSHKDGTPVKYAVDATYERSWVKQTSAVSSGQSFERDSASAGWDDLSSSEYDEGATEDEGDEPCCCARIKAFTTNTEATVAVSIPIEQVKVTVPDVTYTGASLAPALTITYGSATLQKGADYTVTYENNVNAGPGTAVVVGKGRFSGTKRVSFNVLPKNISGLAVGAPANQTYTGKELKPKPTVKDGSKNLKEGTDYTLSYANNVNPGTATVTVTGKGNYTGTKSANFTIKGIPAVTVAYQTHVQRVGWQDWRRDGAMAGTSGRGLRLEGINIKLEGAQYSGGIEYRTHVQKIGWQGYRANGAMSGTSGRGLRLEAIQIRLTGEMATKYDVWYRVHAQSYGWLGWAKNDSPAGTAGFGKRLEGIEIKVLPKGSAAPGAAYGAFVTAKGDSPAQSYSSHQVLYKTHVQSFGWQGWVADGQTSGTTGLSKRLEGIDVKLNEQPVSGSIEYRTHVQKIGWQGYVRDGAMSGTSGRALRLEAIQIRLTGDMERRYDVWYRVHAQTFGWMGWAKNDQQAGTAGYGKRLESIQILILPKGSAAPGSTANAFRRK